eukprot:TRINITY_DN50821_c0_g1_i1.p1 TRINITY_DN50821_c0_g1~~TRINITY_DN50821_c0_g1_i1.p1  ORF type:complete len:1003 (+),score=287.00 TRINITY_DN50821_c0_g1_i1:71-3010(+)
MAQHGTTPYEDSPAYQRQPSGGAAAKTPPSLSAPSQGALVADGGGRLFAEEPPWPLSAAYRRGPKVDEARRIPSSALTLVPLAVLGLLLVGCIAFAGVSAGAGLTIDASEAGQRCADVGALRGDPATLLYADAYSGFEAASARPHPSGFAAWAPRGAAWLQLARRCRDVALSGAAVALCGALLALVTAVSLVRVVLSAPLGLNAQFDDFDALDEVGDDTVLAQRSVALFRRSAQRMCQLHDQIRAGSRAFLVASYRWMLPTGVVLAVLCIAADAGGSGWRVAVCALLALLASAGAGWLGMTVAALANVRTAFAAGRGLNDGLRLAFNASTVMALAVAAAGLSAVGLCFLMMRDTWALVGCALGVSWVAVFLRFAGGIFTKAADTGAEAARRAEGLEEESPTSSATIATFAGDNVAGVAGAGADLLQSYLMAITGAMHLGGAPYGKEGIAVPLYLAAVGVVCGLCGCVAVCAPPDRTPPGDAAGLLAWQADVRAKMLRSLRVGSILAAGMALAVGALICGLSVGWRAVVAYIIGSLAGLMCSHGWFTEYATSAEYAPTQNLAGQSVRGAAAVVTRGLSVGMKSAAVPLLFTFATVLIATMAGDSAARRGAGEYCVGIAAVGLMSTLVVNVCGQCFAAVTDNAGGLGRVCLSGRHAAVRARTDALDELGNTTTAAGKAFATAASALSSYVLCLVFVQEVLAYSYPEPRPGSSAGGGDNVLQWAGDEVFFRMDARLLRSYTINALDKRFVAGLLLGVGAPFLTAALAMDAVSDAAASVEEAVRQEVGAGADPQRRAAVLSGAELPNTHGCVQICTTTALKRSLMPVLIALCLPLFAGFAGGPIMLAGVLLGCFACTLALSSALTNAGAAWENAKQYTTLQRLTTKDDAGRLLRLVRGPKGADTWMWVRADGGEEAAAVLDGGPARDSVCVGDELGDPCRETAGPGLNTMLKLMVCVAAAAAPAIRAACDRDPIWTSHCFRQD